ncbi:MAG TPA: hypothetical protein VK716_08390 [Terracidiphilus sp.]|nr:hypothetical protein [Terracidiphilus sp.]
MGSFRKFAFAVLSSVFCLPLFAQGDPSAIQQKLSGQFKLTSTTADRSDIVTAGDIVVLHKSGLVMYSTASPLPPSNTYKNGKIGQGWGGFGKDLAIGMASTEGTTANDYPHRAFVADEKCWVTKIEVQKDGVLFVLYSDPYNDVRYYGNLKIPFPNKKEVPTADVALQSVAEVLGVVPADDAGGQNNSNGASQAAAQAPAGPAMAAIPPPPPPADTAPATISLGQSRDQVTAGLGQPLKDVKVGVKEILVYKDMKVTLKDGKVTDVE